MIEKRFATPRDAEKAFYRAFENADLTAMIDVWAEEEEIVCAHPGGPRHVGLIEVRESWRQIFSQGAQLKFQLVGLKAFPGRMLHIHSLYEHVTIVGDSRPATPVLATNVYLLTDRGWQMYMHHASPLSAPVEADAEPRSILH
ncbi:MAG: nuclear transport factor 2 family protein [Burkholderiales bacterium]